MTPRPNTKLTLIFKKIKNNALALGYHVRPSRAKNQPITSRSRSLAPITSRFEFFSLIEYVLPDLVPSFFFNCFFPSSLFCFACCRLVCPCARERDAFALVCTNASDARSLERFALVCTSACSRSFENSFLFSYTYHDFVGFFLKRILLKVCVP